MRQFTVKPKNITAANTAEERKLVLIKVDGVNIGFYAGRRDISPVLTVFVGAAKSMLRKPDMGGWEWLVHRGGKYMTEMSLVDTADKSEEELEELRESSLKSKTFPELYVDRNLVWDTIEYEYLTPEEAREVVFDQEEFESLSV